MGIQIRNQDLYNTQRYKLKISYFSVFMKLVSVFDFSTDLLKVDGTYRDLHPCLLSSDYIISSPKTHTSSTPGLLHHNWDCYITTGNVSTEHSVITVSVVACFDEV